MASPTACTQKERSRRANDSPTAPDSPSDSFYLTYRINLDDDRLGRAHAMGTSRPMAASLTPSFPSNLCTKLLAVSGISAGHYDLASTAPTPVSTLGAVPAVLGLLELSVSFACTSGHGPSTFFFVRGNSRFSVRDGDCLLLRSARVPLSADVLGDNGTGRTLEERQAYRLPFGLSRFRVRAGGTTSAT